MVELLISMALFSFLLLVVSSGTIQLIRIYQSGVGIRNTQQLARTFAEEFSQTGRKALAANVTADNTQTITTSTGDKNVNQDTVCLYTSTTATKFQGVMFYTWKSTSVVNRFDIYKVDAPLDGTCVRPAAVIGERLNPDTVSVAQFTVTKPPFGPLVDAAYSFIATSGLQSTDLTLTGPYPVNCLPQIGDQFCAITNSGTSINLRGAE